MSRKANHQQLFSGFSSIAIPAVLVDTQQQHQQQQWQQPTVNFNHGALQFALVQSSHGRRAAPFASLCAVHNGTLNPLFLLSRSASSAEGSSDAASSSVGSSSGYESDTDTGYSSDLHLDQINCQICRQPLNKKPGSKRGLLSWPFGGRSRSSSSSSSSSRGPSCDFLVCDCCQRCFHTHCCKQKGVSTKERDGVWFHSRGCKDCQAGLQQKAQSGPTPLPGGRSWQLIDCAPVNPSGPSGVQALKTLKQHLSDVLEVLLPAYGPGAAQQLVDTTKGYAVLLRQGSLPVTAGLMDVYGQELAVLDLVATAMEEQGKGHCRAMVQALEGWLGPQLGVASLIAVCPADEPRNVQVWQQKFGFKKLSGRELKQLQASVPPLNYYEEATLLCKPLAKQQQTQTTKNSKKQKQHSSEASKPAVAEPKAAEAAAATSAT